MSAAGRARLAADLRELADRVEAQEELIIEGCRVESWDIDLVAGGPATHVSRITASWWVSPAETTKES